MSNKFVGPIYSDVIHEKFGKSPLLTLTSSEMLIQVARGLVRTQKERVQAKNGGVSFSVPPMNPVFPL